MPDAVVAAFVGVVIGAGLNYMLTRRLERRRERLIARGAARILIRDIVDADLMLKEGMGAKRWPPKKGQRFPLDNWKRLSPDLSRGIPGDFEWQVACCAFESMQAENELMDERPNSYDRERLRRVLEHDIYGAMIILDQLNTTVLGRARRWWYSRKDPNDTGVVPWIKSDQSRLVRLEQKWADPQGKD